MRIFDETKSYEIENPNLEYGYLKLDKRLIKSHPYKPSIKEIGHYETVATYSNGGKEVKWVVDVQGREEQQAYDEFEQIQVYVLFSEKQLAQKRISNLKEKLSNTDYQAIKYAEGVMTENEYLPIKTQRESWRAEINTLQSICGI